MKNIAIFILLAFCLPLGAQTVNEIQVIEKKIPIAEKQLKYLIFMLNNENHLNIIKEDLQKEKLNVNYSWIGKALEKKGVKIEDSFVRMILYSDEKFVNILHPAIFYSLLFRDFETPEEWYKFVKGSEICKNKKNIEKFTLTINKLFELQKPLILLLEEKKMNPQIIKSYSRASSFDNQIYAILFFKNYFCRLRTILSASGPGRKQIDNSFCHNQLYAFLKKLFLKMKNNQNFYQDIKTLPIEYLKLIKQYLSWGLELNIFDSTEYLTDDYANDKLKEGELSKLAEEIIKSIDRFVVEKERESLLDDLDSVDSKKETGAEKKTTKESLELPDL